MSLPGMAKLFEDHQKLAEEYNRLLAKDKELLQRLQSIRSAAAKLLWRWRRKMKQWDGIASFQAKQGYSSAASNSTGVAYGYKEAIDDLRYWCGENLH